MNEPDPLYLQYCLVQDLCIICMANCSGPFFCGAFMESKDDPAILYKICEECELAHDE